MQRASCGFRMNRHSRGSDIGSDLFRVACNIVSKRFNRAYGSGRCKHWIKIENPAHPAYSRVRDPTLGYSVPNLLC
jgi:hypothetical protein